MNETQTLPTAVLEDAPVRPRELNGCQRILVVDDEPDIRQLNSELLVRSGFEVDAAEDGASGWEALQLRNYDLLVTDQNMPKISGLGLIRKLRAARMAVPVIMATTVLPTWDFALHPELHPAATLLKPYTFEELLVTVKKVLRAYASADGQIAPPSATEFQPRLAITPQHKSLSQHER
jgi:DNA-binding response OmpR family regulator